MNEEKMAAWRPQMVALDIDGTLVDNAGVLPNDVRRSVRRVVEAGVPVVLATGRGWHDTRPVFEQLGLPTGPAVTSNGSVTVSFPPFQLDRAITFNPGEAIEKVLREHPTAALAAEVVGQGFRVTRNFPAGELGGVIEQVSVDDLVETDVARIVVRDPSSSRAEFDRLARRIGLGGSTYYVGWSAWLDIMPKGVNKATALAEVVVAMGLQAADVLAIGDGSNDVEMLSWAGRGVALGDASPAVQAASDHVTDTFASGGTSQELDRWFGGGSVVRWVPMPRALAS